MFNAHDFFKKRFANHLKETSRYLKYIFNGHIAVAMLFFIAAAAYYYQQWLEKLPDNFPTAVIIGVLFGLLISYSPVRTLLKEPDLIFLMPAEHKMKVYFRDALIYSFVIQLYMVLLLAAALGPLYTATYSERSGRMYLLTIVCLLVFKLWNLLANWWMLKIRNKTTRQTELIIRVIVNCLVFYLLVKGMILFAGIVTVLFIVIFLYDYQYSRKQAGVIWDVLVEKDQHRMQFFYQIANMFTDVPHLKTRVKKRKWLVSLINHVPFQQNRTFDYLYRLTFIRSGDYFGMYVRLVVIGGLLIYFVPNDWMKVIFGLLFLYLSSFQSMTLYQHHRTVMWLDLYPVSATNRRQAILKWLYQLAIVQTLLFTGLFLLMGNFLGAVVMVISGLLFSYLFMTGYVKGKLNKTV